MSLQSLCWKPKSSQVAMMSCVCDKKRELRNVVIVYISYLTKHLGAPQLLCWRHLGLLQELCKWKMKDIAWDKTQLLSVMIQSWTLQCKTTDQEAGGTSSDSSMTVLPCWMASGQIAQGKHLIAHHTVWMKHAQRKYASKWVLVWSPPNSFNNLVYWGRKDFRLCNPLSPHSSLPPPQQLVCGTYSR